MAGALVGTIGAVSTGASGAAVTAAWGTGENRTAGNLLACYVGGSGAATLPVTPSGWTLAVQKAGTSCSMSIYIKAAAGSDAAPTIAAVTSTVLQVQLAEFSGINATIDRSASNAGTTTPLVSTAAGADASVGDLILAGASILQSNSRANAGIAHTINNCSNTPTTNSGTSTLNHYSFTYGFGTANASADSDSFAFTTTQLTGVAVAMVSLTVKPVAVNLTPSAGAVGAATAQVQTPAPLLQTLTDTFSTLDSSKWNPGPSGVSVVAGTLHVQTNPAYYNLHSNQAYDLKGSFALVQVDQSGSSSGSETYLQLYVDDNNKFGFIISGGTGPPVVNFWSEVAGTNSYPNINYDPVAHAWLRLRESGGTLYWDTSPDGYNWTNQQSLGNPFATTVFTVYLMAGNYNGVTTDPDAVFDNFNVPSAGPPIVPVAGATSQARATVTAALAATPQPLVASAGVQASAASFTTATALLGVVGTQSVVTVSNLAAARYDYTGYVGMQIVVGPSPITAQSLGRWVLPGDVAPIQMFLYDGGETQIGSATLDPTTVPANQFGYAPLGTPVTLSAGAGYFVMFVATQTTGADPWCNDTFMSPGPALSAVVSAYGSPGSFVLANGNYDYGPMDLLYSVATPVAAQAATTATATVNVAAVTVPQSLTPIAQTQTSSSASTRAAAQLALSAGIASSVTLTMVVPGVAFIAPTASAGTQATVSVTAFTPANLTLSSPTDTTITNAIVTALSVVNPQLAQTITAVTALVSCTPSLTLSTQATSSASAVVVTTVSLNAVAVATGHAFVDVGAGSQTNVFAQTVSAASAVVITTSPLLPSASCTTQALGAVSAASTGYVSPAASCTTGAIASTTAVTFSGGTAQTLTQALTTYLYAPTWLASNADATTSAVVTLSVAQTLSIAPVASINTSATALVSTRTLLVPHAQAVTATDTEVRYPGQAPPYDAPSSLRFVYVHPLSMTMGGPTSVLTASAPISGLGVADQATNVSPRNYRSTLTIMPVASTGPGVSVMVARARQSILA